MSSASANIVTVLALYFAALILTLQHVSGRHSPFLGVPVLVRHASIPLMVLLILAATAVLAPIEGRKAGVMVFVAILMLVELYGETELERHLGNAMLFNDSHVHEQNWLRSESYAPVKRAHSQRR